MARRGELNWRVVILLVGLGVARSTVARICGCSPQSVDYAWKHRERVLADG